MTSPPVPPADCKALVDGVRAAVEGARSTVESADHAVTVTVGPAGAVLDLTLSRQAFRYRGADLGALIVEMIKSASEQVQEQLSDAVRLPAADVSGVEAVLGTGTAKSFVDAARGEDDR